MASDFEKRIKKFNRKTALQATNKTGSRRSFYSNVLFRELAYSDTPSFTGDSHLMPIRNFQKFENYLYGRIDTDFYAVTPKKLGLAPIYDAENQHALAFVTSAFNSMREEISIDVASGKIPPDIPHISDMKAVKAFEDINVSYNSWVENYLKGSFGAYVQAQKKAKEIVDFESFVKIFREHLLILSTQMGAVNFSSFCLIYRSNIRNSGLCIEIADLDFSKNSDKLEFADHALFPYYIGMAEKYGFFVDYNAPWRLVFNLASEVVTAKPSWNGLFSFFDQAFQRAYLQDLTILKNLFFSSYRDYRNRFPSFIKETIEASGCLKREKIVRQKYKKEEFDNKYTDRYWLKFYIDLKNQEKNLDFDSDQLDKIKKRSLDYEKYVDIRRSLSYINKVFQDIPSTEGSYYYLASREKYRTQDPLPFEEFDEYIRDIVKSYK